MLTRTLPTMLAVASLFASSFAQAATLDTIRGGVTLNRGDGYKPVQQSTKVKRGDTVMAGPNGQARIVYDDGCTVQVVSDGVVTIAPESPCALGALNNAEPGLIGPGMSPNTTLLMTGAIVLGGAGIAAIVVHNNKQTPASP